MMVVAQVSTFAKLTAEGQCFLMPMRTSAQAVALFQLVETAARHLMAAQVGSWLRPSHLLKVARVGVSSWWPHTGAKRAFRWRRWTTFVPLAMA